MDVTVKVRDGVAIARLGGKLAAGVGDRQLHDLIDELLSDHRKRILLDLSEVTGIDSSGVGELVAGLRVARELGAEVKILKGNERVHRILDLTQVLPLFDVHENEDEALAAFGTGGASRSSGEAEP